MKIYVVRHGQTELNKKNLINGRRIDEPLSPEGVEQAHAATLILPSTIKRIYASSLERAVQTARILNEKVNARISFHDELQEVDFGIFSGTPFVDELKRRHVEQNYDWRPSGESIEEVEQRVLSILKIIKSENADSEALIVSHGGIIRLLHLLEFNAIMGDIGNASIHSFDLDKIV